MTVFLAVIKSADAPPHDFLFAPNRPCASAVRRSAFSAEEQLSQRVLSAVFSLFGLCADLFDFPLAGSSCPFLLRSAEGGGVDDGRVIVFYIVFGTLAVVDLHLFGEAVGSVTASLTGSVCESGTDSDAEVTGGSVTAGVVSAEDSGFCGAVVSGIT